MSDQQAEPRQIVDLRAASIAGLAAGVVFFLGYALWIPRVIGGSPWMMIRQLGAIPLGDGVLAPPATFHGPALAAGLATHLVLSLGAAYLIALVLHRFGLMVGVLGGALFGLAAYAIAIYGGTYLFPWFFAMNGLPFLVIHVVFGAVAGGVYELLEREVFVDANGNVVPDPDLSTGAGTGGR